MSESDVEIRGTVLVVDDNDRLRETLERALKQAGYLTFSAADGEGALQMLSAIECEVIVTDIYMPKMDGIELLTSLLDRVPDARVVAMSAGGSMTADTLLEDARLLGAVHVLTKPFRTEELLELIDACVE